MADLVLVVNDPPLYWFVTLLKLNQTDRVLLRKHFGSCFGSGRNGTCRFLTFNRAVTHFEAMTRAPEWAAEIDKAQKSVPEKERTPENLTKYRTMRSLSKKVQKSAFGKSGDHPGWDDEPIHELELCGNRS
jgi:hypothetical protein